MLLLLLLLLPCVVFFYEGVDRVVLGWFQGDGTNPPQQHYPPHIVGNGAGGRSTRWPLQPNFQQKLQQ